MEQDDLLFSKEGQYKSAMLSIPKARKFFFYPNRIIMRPVGVAKLFSTDEIVIKKEDIVNIREGFKAGFGYLVELKTGSSNYSFVFLGDKSKILSILKEYFGM